MMAGPTDLSLRDTRPLSRKPGCRQIFWVPWQLLRLRDSGWLSRWDTSDVVPGTGIAGKRCFVRQSARFGGTLTALASKLASPNRKPAKLSGRILGKGSRHWPRLQGASVASEASSTCWAVLGIGEALAAPAPIGCIACWTPAMHAVARAGAAKRDPKKR